MLLFTGACVCQVCHRWLITYQRSSENIVHIKEPLSDIQPLSASAGCQWPLQCCLSLPPSSILLSQSGLKLESINLILIKPCIMSSSPRVSLTALRSRSITAQDLCRQDLCEEACLSSNKTRQKWHFTPSGYGTIKIKQFFRFSDSLQREKRTKNKTKQQTSSPPSCVFVSITQNWHLSLDWELLFTETLVYVTWAGLRGEV